MTKMRRIKGYKSMSKERLLRALSESELIEKEKNLDNERLKKIRKDFNKSRYGFSKSKKKRLEKTFMKQKTKRIFLNQK